MSCAFFLTVKQMQTWGGGKKVSAREWEGSKNPNSKYSPWEMTIHKSTHSRESSDVQSIKIKKAKYMLRNTCTRQKIRYINIGQYIKFFIKKRNARKIPTHSIECTWKMWQKNHDEILTLNPSESQMRIADAANDCVPLQKVVISLPGKLRSNNKVTAKMFLESSAVNVFVNCSRRMRWAFHVLTRFFGKFWA